MEKKALRREITGKVVQLSRIQMTVDVKNASSGLLEGKLGNYRLGFIQHLVPRSRQRGGIGCRTIKREAIEIRGVIAR